MITSRTRLAKLEQQTQVAASLDYRPMLVEVLARRDAIWWPLRIDPKHNAGWVRQRQKADRAGSYAVSAKATGRTDWLSSMELRNALVTRGLCKAKKTKAGEVSGLSITPQGEADARALVGSRLSTLATVETQIVFHYLRLRGSTLKGPILESLLFHRTLSGYPDDWEHLTETVMPLITAGVVTATRDGIGRLYFSLVAEDLPEAVSSDEPCDPAMDNIYLEAFRDETNRLEQLESCPDVVIPLPVSNGLHEFHPDDHDPDFEAKRGYIEKLEYILCNFGVFTPPTDEQTEGE